MPFLLTDVLLVNEYILGHLKEATIARRVKKIEITSPASGEYSS